MSLFSSMHSFFDSSNKEETIFLSKVSDPKTLDNLFAFLNNYITQPQIKERYANRYKDLLQYSSKRKEIEAIKLFAVYEEFLTKNRPPIILKESSTENLRDEIMSEVPIANLNKTFRLLFLKDNEKLIVLFEMVLQAVGYYIHDVVGSTAWHDLLVSITTNTSFDGLLIDQHEVSLPKTIRDKFLEMPIDSLSQELTTFYGSLYAKSALTFGEEHAKQPFLKIYEFVKKNFPYEIISLLLDILPIEIFEQERSEFKGRRELEKIIQQKTSDLEHTKRLLEEQVKDLENSKKAMLNILEDVEEERKKNALQAEDLKKFQLAVQNASDQVIITDSQGIILYANPMLEQMTGWTIQEALGKKAGSLWGGLMEKEFYERMWDTVKNKKQNFAGEIKNKKKDGTIYYVWNSISPIVSNTGEVSFFVAIERDITKEKEEKERIERLVKERTQELTKEHARLQSSLSNLKIGFLMTDANDNIIFINQVAKNIFLNPQNISTVSLLQDFLKNSGVTFELQKEIYESQASNKSSEKKEIYFNNKYYHIYTSPINSKDETSEKLIGSVVLIEDITEERVLQRSRDEFFSIASHELRTPLTAIRGNTSILNDYFGAEIKNPEIKEILNDIHESSMRLIDIVNDFLDMSRLEQGKIKYVDVSFDVNKLCADIIKEYDVTGSRQKIYLKIDQPQESLPFVYADQNRIRQIIINLVGNAIKFTSEGGITISFGVITNLIKVYVTDTGKGISPENQVLLFRKFQQAQSNILTRDTTKGTGLGLYISRLMAREMGGDVIIERSEINRGSTFSVSMPIATPEQKEATQQLLEKQQNA